MAALIVVSACAARIPFELEGSAAPINQDTYRSAAQTDAKIYQIVPAESLVLIRVGRAGTMAHLGHDHVVASTDLEGLVAIASDSATSFADVAMPLKNLIVDNAAYRQRLGLESEPSESDIASTYSNMQRALEAQTWPWVNLHVQFADARIAPPLAKVSISMHGVTHQLVVPIVLQIGDEQLTVEGQFSVKQSDFGITPFSALGGLLRVADELDIQFELVAERREVR